MQIISAGKGLEYKFAVVLLNIIGIVTGITILVVVCIYSPSINE